MKTIIVTFLILSGLNSALAGSVCQNLFTQKKGVKQSFAVSGKTNSIRFQDRFDNFIALRDRIETLRSENKTVAEIVKIKVPELNGDVLKQIEFLKEFIKDAEYEAPFVKELMQIHINNLEAAIKKGFTLEEHYRLSLKTTILLDDKTGYEGREQSEVFRFTKLEKERLKKFIQNKKISDEEFVKSFPSVKEFLTEWKKSVDLKSESRILVFSTLRMGLPKFNETLSPDISLLGLVNRKENPDSQGITGSIGFASHDLSHHALFRTQTKHWNNARITYEQRRLLQIDIRNRYVIERNHLDPKPQMSLDILFFESLHEDSNILSKFIHLAKYNRQYKEKPTYNESNILSYAELYGLQLGARLVFTSEAEQSSISILLKNRTSQKKVYQEVYPTWKILTDIWMKSTDAVVE